MFRMTIAAITPIMIILGVMSISDAANVSSDSLQVRNENGIPFVSGGFGVEERAALRKLARSDNVELSFALEDDEYLGGAKLLIKDEHGKTVLQTASNGPLFYTKLPQGNYTVMATAMGKTMTQTLAVPENGRVRLYFAWKNAGQEQHRLAKNSASELPRETERGYGQPTSERNARNSG